MANVAFLLRFCLLTLAVVFSQTAAACPQGPRDLIEKTIGGEALDPDCLRTWAFDQIVSDGTEHVAWALGEHLGIAIEAAIRDVPDDEIAAAVYRLLVNQVRFQPSVREVDDFRAALSNKTLSPTAKAWILGALAGLSENPPVALRGAGELIWAFLWVDEQRAASHFKIATREVCVGEGLCVPLPKASCPPWADEHAIASFKVAELGVGGAPICQLELLEKIHFRYYYMSSNQRQCTFITSANLGYRWTTLDAGIRDCDSELRVHAADLDFTGVDAARVAVALVRSGQLDTVPWPVRDFLDSNGYFKLLRDLCAEAACEE